MQENEQDEVTMPEVSETAAPEMNEIAETAVPEKMKKNGVVRVLHAVAMALYLFGGILGLVAFVQSGGQVQFLGALMTMLSTWVSYAIYGSLLLGCSELLRLLERIADK